MTGAECIRCGANGRPSHRWKAIGYSLREGRRPVAFLQCLECGGRFYSSLPEALEAAEPFRVERAQQVPEPIEVPTTLPTLFRDALPRRSEAFTRIGESARGRNPAEVVDWARRAAGERDE